MRIFIINNSLFYINYELIRFLYLFTPFFVRDLNSVYMFIGVNIAIKPLKHHQFHPIKLLSSFLVITKT